MSKKAADRYQALEQRLQAGQKGCPGHPCLTDAEDDRIREKMDDLWWKMSVKEREAANDRGRKSLKDKTS